MKGDSARIKKLLIKAYNKGAAEYGLKRNKRFDLFLNQEMDHFIESVGKVGRKIIDLGSGPGNESLYFKNKGLEPVCVDISPAMIKQCRSKDLEAYVMDFCNLKFPDKSFAGVWMSFSLIHTPKAEALAVIKEVSRVILNRGVLYLSLFEGSGEGLSELGLERYGSKRYFAYYSQNELANLLKDDFEIIKSSRLDMSPKPTISFECLKL